MAAQYLTTRWSGLLARMRSPRPLTASIGHLEPRANVGQPDRESTKANRHAEGARSCRISGDLSARLTRYPEALPPTYWRSIVRTVRRHCRRTMVALAEATEGGNRCRNGETRSDAARKGRQVPRIRSVCRAGRRAHIVARTEIERSLTSVAAGGLPGGLEETRPGSEGIARQRGAGLAGLTKEAGKP